MFPPVFSLAFASVQVKSLLGSNPLRLYLFGEATQNTPRPYAVWQTVFGLPENFISGRPQEDSWGVQIDVYANSPSEARNVAKALRDAYEGSAYVTRWNGESKEAETNLYRYSFDVEFIVRRS